MSNVALEKEYLMNACPSFHKLGFDLEIKFVKTEIQLFNLGTNIRKKKLKIALY